MNTMFNPRVLDKIAYQQGIRTDTKLAEHLGVNRATINRWRRGTGNPSYAVLCQMVLRDGITFEEMRSGPSEVAA